MKKIKSVVMIAGVISTLTGCARIGTGEVGLRVNFDKTVASEELQPGSYNQTAIGDVLHFQVRSIAVSLENKNPQTADNSTLKDFDVTAIYEVNSSSVSELWTKQSRAFHVSENGEIFLMYNYVQNIINSSAYKAVRKFNAMAVADNRDKIEQDIKKIATEALKEEHLENAITISQVQVRSALPSDDIVSSANAVVRAQNELKAKSVEVETAKQEAVRIQTLNSNSQAIPYMNAMSNMEIAKAVREGKVNTIIIPTDFKGMVNVSGK